MGNGQQKYLTQTEARDILGQESWVRLKSQLEKYKIKYLDFETFDGILRSRFDRMVSTLTTNTTLFSTLNIYLHCSLNHLQKPCMQHLPMI